MSRVLLAPIVVAASVAGRVSSGSDSFAVLGLPFKMASRAEVTAAYRRAALAVHPNRACLPTDIDCIERANVAMQQLNLARDRLLDPLQQLNEIEFHELDVSSRWMPLVQGMNGLAALVLAVGACVVGRLVASRC